MYIVYETLQGKEKKKIAQCKTRDDAMSEIKRRPLKGLRVYDIKEMK